MWRRTALTAAAAVSRGTVNINSLGRARQFSAAAATGGSSFISRFKQKLEKSFEDSKKNVVAQSTEENEQRLMNLLLKTPKKQFSMKTLRDFYAELKTESEAKADGFIASRNPEVQQNLDQLRRIVKMFDSFTEDEQRYPMIIGPSEINRVALETMQPTKAVDGLVKGAMGTMQMHAFIVKRRAQSLPLPRKPQEIQAMMVRDHRKQRLQGGYKAHKEQREVMEKKERMRKAMEQRLEKKA